MYSDTSRRQNRHLAHLAVRAEYSLQVRGGYGGWTHYCSQPIVWPNKMQNPGTVLVCGDEIEEGEVCKMCILHFTTNKMNINE